MKNLTWGYHASEGARIFELEPDEALPAGWYDSPARVNEPAVEPAPEPVPAARHPLDHDGDGRKGGSRPKAERTRR